MFEDPRIQLIGGLDDFWGVDFQNLLGKSRQLIWLDLALIHFQLILKPSCSFRGNMTPVVEDVLPYFLISSW